MSTFAVTLEKIKEIRPHGNADRLEIGTVESMSFQFVVKKGAYKAGDPVVYFPLDAVIPEKLQEALEVKGYLKKDRVQTVRLRGVISQGLVAPLRVIEDYLDLDMDQRNDLQGYVALGVNDLSEKLGVTKYEPEEVECRDAIQKGMPPEVSVYDIEAADRLPAVVEKLMNQPVEVTEKLEGQNVWFHVKANVHSRLTMGQHRRQLEPKEGRVHWLHRYAEDRGQLPHLSKIARDLGAKNYLTLRGEAVGPGLDVKNIYRLDKIQIYFFDLEIDGESIPKADFHRLVPAAHRVPILSIGFTLREFLNGQTIQERSDGASRLNPNKRREGIVVTPTKEQFDEQIGRLFLKQRSPLYLAKVEL